MTVRIINSESRIVNCKIPARGLSVSIITCASGGREVGHLVNNSSLGKNMKKVPSERMGSRNDGDIII